MGSDEDEFFGIVGTEVGDDAPELVRLCGRAIPVKDLTEEQAAFLAEALGSVPAELPCGAVLTSMPSKGALCPTCHRTLRRCDCGKLVDCCIAGICPRLG